MMMRKVWKNVTALCLALVMMFSVLPVQAAESLFSVPSTYTITAYSSKDVVEAGGAKLNVNYFITVPGEITNLKSSDKNVVSVSKNVARNGTIIYLTAKKKGTATVSFKYNSKTYKTKVKVLKYKNPISSVKIGDTTVKKSKFASSANYSLKYSQFKGQRVKVNIKLADGWVLGYSGSNQYNYWRPGWGKSETQDNGKKVTVKGGKGFSIQIHVVNSSTGQEEDVIIFFL